MGERQEVGSLSAALRGGWEVNETISRRSAASHWIDTDNESVVPHPSGSLHLPN